MGSEGGSQVGGAARTHSRVRPARGPGQRRAPSGGQLQGSGQCAPLSARGSAGGSSNSSASSGHSAGDGCPMAGEPECRLWRLDGRP